MRFLKKYSLYILILSALVSGIIFYGGKLSKMYTNYIDESYSKMGYLTPSVSGNAMGVDYVFDINIPKDKSNLVIFGASTSIIGINENNLLGYNVVKACSGSADIASYIIMNNFLKEEGYNITGMNDSLNANLVKVDISPVTFKVISHENEVISSAITGFDSYSVNRDLSVNKSNFSSIKTFVGLNLRRIENAIDTIVALNKNGSLKEQYKTENLDWENYYDLVSFDSERVKAIEDFILQFKDTGVVVDILYMHSSLSESLTGKAFNKYVDEYLIPMLEENNITYIDSRECVEDEYYKDNIHLDNEGCNKYTNFIKKSLKEAGYGI